MCILFTVYIILPSAFSGDNVRAEADAADVHALPDAGAGEGVSLQPLSHSATPDRDSPHAGLIRTSDKDLVPEPKNEVEKRKQYSEVDRTRSLKAGK